MLPLLRLNDVRGELQALWRDSATEPAAEENKKESHRMMKLFHGVQIMASITHRKSLSSLRSLFISSETWMW